jgi:hypothetical protein
MMTPWRIRTAAAGRIGVRFEPDFERISENGARDSYFVNAHQMFGRYLGRITSDNSGPAELHDLFGWIEDHEARPGVRHRPRPRQRPLVPQRRTCRRAFPAELSGLDAKVVALQALVQR